MWAVKVLRLDGKLETVWERGAASDGEGDNCPAT